MAPGILTEALAQQEKLVRVPIARSFPVMHRKSGLCLTALVGCDEKVYLERGSGNDHLSLRDMGRGYAETKDIIGTYQGGSAAISEIFIPEGDLEKAPYGTVDTLKNDKGFCPLEQKWA